MGTAFMRRYVLIGPIGHGGVSVVYQALDTVRAQPMAIKMLDPALAGDHRAQEKIRREAMITDRMRHPSVPRIYDFGDAPLGNGTVVPYVVMELLSGEVLASRLAGGALPWPEAVSIAATAADVLVVAHRRGVVHRDLTPANIMITRTGVKIIDFGVAVTVRSENAHGGPFISGSSTVPPNDFAGPGEPADDVYALGVLLYTMLTGRSPYPSGEANTLLGAGELRWVAPTPVLTVAGLPKVVAEICRSCMAKRPADRPDAASVALALWSLIVPDPPAGAGGWLEPGPPPDDAQDLWVPGDMVRTRPARPVNDATEPGPNGKHRRGRRMRLRLPSPSGLLD
jgi:serine/threonine-protein kinase